MFQDPIRNLKATMNHAGLNERMLETDKYTPEVEEGDIIIFPSFVEHYVLSGGTGSTIAGNVFLTPSPDV